MNKNLWAVAFTVFFVYKSYALERIDEVKIDRKKPFTIYMHAGRVTTIDMPCSISYAVPGSHGDVQTVIGPDKDSSLLIWLSNDQARATNLTVRCGEKVIIFDIVPGRSHQDYLKVSALATSDGTRKLVATSSAPATATVRQVSRKIKLLKSSEDSK